jgi:hypothetical protein
VTEIRAITRVNVVDVAAGRIIPNSAVVVDGMVARETKAAGRALMTRSNGNLQPVARENA